MSGSGAALKRKAVFGSAVVTARGVLTGRSAEVRARQQEVRASILGADTWKKFWRGLDALRNPSTAREVFFPARSLAKVFLGRMNRLEPAPEGFDMQRRAMNDAVVLAIPRRTVDTTEEQFFSRPFTLDEIGSAKKKLRPREGAAAGGDQITYGEIGEMDNEALLELCNSCLMGGEAPTTWVRTVLVGLCKKGKAREDPQNYRTIGLESCLLKFMTLLVNERLTEWAESRGLIPPSQNGFRSGYRTANNMFILRNVLDQARAARKPLYVAYVDMTNAFPSVDHATLWLKLRNWGAGGRVFDWLRHLYGEMSYVVCHGGEESDVFHANMGILIGDTCSPILWALYLADLPRYVDVGDGRVRLNDVLVGSLEQADDILLISTTREGLQRRLDGVARWCAVNFMEINKSKSVVMVFGRDPGGRTPFSVSGVDIGWAETQTYVGYHLSSAKVASILREHYGVKASTAESVGRTIWAYEQRLGQLPVETVLLLYKMLVDPHLTHGCEVALDTAQDALKPLVRVQKAFFRRLLALGKRGATVVLWTETGILPIRYRRLLLALTYLLYVVRTPGDRWVWKALQAALDLDFRGRPSWVSDLRKVLSGLPFECTVPAHGEWTNPRVVEELWESVRRGALGEIQRAFDASSKLYLLHGRLEVGAGNRKGVVTTAVLRHYLRLESPKHRKALTRVLVSAHKYAVEIHQYAKVPVPREERVCRYGCGAVETPEHVWLQCEGSEDLVRLRGELQRRVVALCTEDELVELLSCDGDPAGQLRLLVSKRGCVAATAEFAYEVEKVLKKSPLAWR